MQPSGATAEDKSPLLEPESPEEKYDIPEDVAIREHNRGVYQGVAVVVKRWPDHISSGWMPVIYLIFFILILSLSFICFELVLGKMTFSVNFRFQVGRYDLDTNETLLDFSISCEGRTISTTRFPEAVEQLTRSRFLQHHPLYPLTTPTSNTTAEDKTEPLERLFFIAREEDITTERLCSVESAVKLLPNIAVYFVILHNHELEPSNLEFFVENLETEYKNLSIHRIGTKKYFSGSPLSDVFQYNSAPKFMSADMTEFAARILTLWRYGGVSVDSGVAVWNGSSFPGRDNASNDEVVLSETGSVISAAYQCHELLFQIMSTLAKLSSEPNHLYTTAKEIISLSVKNFCFNQTNQTTTKSSGVDSFPNVCPGVSLMRSELMCKSIDDSDTCLWIPTMRMDSMEKKQLCPLTFEQFRLVY